MRGGGGGGEKDRKLRMHVWSTTRNLPTRTTAGAGPPRWKTTSSGLISCRPGDAPAKALIQPPYSLPSSSSTSSSSHQQRGASRTPISLRRASRQADWQKPVTMRGSPRHGTALGFMVLLNALLLATQAAEGVLTDHVLVQLHEEAQDEAHQLAAQHGFQSARKVGCLSLQGPWQDLELIKKKHTQNSQIKSLFGTNILHLERTADLFLRGFLRFSFDWHFLIWWRHSD